MSDLSCIQNGKPTFGLRKYVSKWEPSGLVDIKQFALFEVEDE